MSTVTDTQMHHRTFTIREFNAAERTFAGIGVPFDTPVKIRDWAGEYEESFAPGSVRVDGKALVLWRHDEPIGIITEHEDRADGWFVRGRLSDTPRGTEAHTLLRDGVVDQLSIGFWPVRSEVDEDGNITRREVLAREVSLVPFGAYGNAAKVSEVRHAANPDAHERSTPMPTTEAEVIDLEARERVEELERSIATFTAEQREDTPAPDMRSAGAFVQALAAGDEDAIAAYNRSQEHRYDEIQHRAYTGGTTADAPIKDGWVGDLTRIFDASSGVLSRIFSTGTLPSTGMNVEFAELLANTVSVAEQAAEGDDLAYGKVTLTTRTAPVKTYGGYVQLTRQQIQRSTLPILNRSLQALAVAAGARKKAVLRAAYATLVSAREGVAANGGVLLLGGAYTASTEKQWTDLVIDAAIRFDGLDLPIDHLLVSPHVFKYLKDLAYVQVVEVEEGEVAIGGSRSFKLSPANPQAGVLNLPGLTGDLAGISVVADPGFTTAQAAFVNGDALRQYDSALVSLQDENVINLSKDFSVYRYGAVAAEIPAAVVPVKFAAS